MNAQNTSPEIPVYIGLGTNLGDRYANLQNAVQMLSPAVDVIAQSPVYSTPPWGFEDQPEFLNQVVFAKTSQQPEELLKFLKQIEFRIGRTPTFQYGPRVVDLDILFYADLVIDKDGLQIPHPRLHERAFVLVPLFDLNPHLRHPALNLTIQKLLLDVDTSGVTRFAP